jgi:hypothetical protein
VDGDTPVTGRVNISVGTSASGVFAKQVNITTNTTNNPSYSYTGGEIWIYFYSNPAGTIPLDITSLGLTVNVNDHLETKEFGVAESDKTVEDISYNTAATGNKVKIYSGTFYEYSYDPYYSDPDKINADEKYEYHQFELQPGTGYVVI